MPLNAPHRPIVPTKEWQGKSGLGKYGDFVMETDWSIGQMMEAVDKAGISKNTLIILTSDNGCSRAAGIGKLEEQGHYPGEQRRGSKSDIWDGGHRIPFIVRWPDRVKAASRSDQLICLTDLMATCAEIVGAKLPETAGEDSVSIVRKRAANWPGKKRRIEFSLFEDMVGHVALADISGSLGRMDGDASGRLCRRHPAQLYFCRPRRRSPCTPFGTRQGAARPPAHPSLVDDRHHRCVLSSEVSRSGQNTEWVLGTRARAISRHGHLWDCPCDKGSLRCRVWCSRGGSLTAGAAGTYGQFT
ncbi:sulfatase-like hydrolase/transferase [Humisphaera borealis]|uniref:Sulfatase-like hydrolase/transferase n=1 Tax=Humisphaera borealis TaxID=2807512 RepID=A0A7M2WZ40_9BACT|nr:sulfatase-like hydrolase/transferase [Humisphaera borealis]